MTPATAESPHRQPAPGALSPAAQAVEYIQGIDVSHWQGSNINHQEVADSGMHFCICKATEGRDWEDPTFEVNIEKIRAVTGETYYPGAYHFARPDSVGGAADGRAEAEDFCDVVQRVCGDVSESFMPPALDFEKYSEWGGAENIPWIEAWIEVVEDRLKRRPMIYTGKNVWRYEVSNTSTFVHYPLWLVKYSGALYPTDSMESLPWSEFALWQYSGGGSFQHHPAVPGVGVVDVNKFPGTLEDLGRFASGGVEPIAPIWPPPPVQLDLNMLRGTYSAYTARVQGLLLAHGYGPKGLTGSDGLPDGLSGSKTEGYLVDFKVSQRLPANTVVDWETWWTLTLTELLA